MTYTKEEIEQKVKELREKQPWNHDIELPFGIRTIGKEQKSYGKNLIKWERIRPYIEKISLEGKRVLDIGCGEGFFSIKMRKCGAKEVIGIDADNKRIKKAQFVVNACGIDGVFFKQKSIFDNDLKELGRFDFVLCLGFLHRVPEIYTGIKNLTDISDIILFEWKASTYEALPVVEFRGGKSKDENEYSRLYWAPSISFLVEILKSLGFKYNFPIEDQTKWRRAILISSRFNHSIFKNNVQLKSRFFLFYKYSKIHALNIYKILTRKINR